MSEVILSLNNNVLKASYVGKDGFRSISTQLPVDVANDSTILDVSSFSQSVVELVNQIVDHKDLKKTSLVFVSQPQDMFLRFITVNKTNGEYQTQILSDIESKLDGASIDDLYYTYFKIAPFVYQFVGVNKAYLEKFLEVSNECGMPLSGIYSWMGLLPKYLNLSDPSIFVTKVNNEQVVALSELGGIFYTGVFEKGKSQEELEDLVKNLSVYKRNSPITKIYTFNYDDFEPDSGFEVYKVDVPNVDETSVPGFEVNMLVNYMIDFDTEMKMSGLNMLNLFPLPEIVKKKVPSVMVGAGALVVVSILAVIGYFGFFRNQNSNADNQLAVNPQENLEVLSESSESQQTGTQGENPAGEVAVELKKDELSIKVENGSNVNGAASRVKDKLAELGYKVLTIDTADSTRETTLLQFKKDKSVYKDLVTADLKDVVENVVVEETLADDSVNDLVIILGTTIKL